MSETAGEITITLKRGKSFIMCKAPATVFMDGEEVAKLKNNESVEFRTTAGKHEFQVKALSALSAARMLDVQDGDTVKASIDFVGWTIALERRSFPISMPSVGLSSPGASHIMPR